MEEVDIRIGFIAGVVTTLFLALFLFHDAEKQQMVDLKDLGAAFISKCQEIGGSREMSLVITNAEQAVMWAVKHVTKWAD